MPRYVRVRTEAGHKITLDADLPDGHPRGIKPGMEVLDGEPALGRGRQPLPPKYRVPLGSPPAPSAGNGFRWSEPVTPEPVPAVDQSPEAPEGHPLADTEEE